MTDLIERLEAASGPSRELDAEIFIAAVYPDWRIQTDCGDWPEQVQPGRIQEPKNCGWRNAPAYTASIDAALTLVPEHMRDELEITTLHQVARVALNLNHGPDDGPYYGSHACNSIPLAICIAALRAREADRG